MRHEFVEFIPDKLVKDVLYVSMPFATAVHTCACGCGLEVVTPFSPTDWSMEFDGEVISLHPSIGNWSFPCQSHYLIKRGRVIWVPSMSRKDIDAGRASDRSAKEQQFGTVETKAEASVKKGMWRRLLDWLIS